MMIRLMNKGDEKELRKIHEKHYKNEFQFPFDDYHHLLDKYIVTDENDDIVIFGALEVVVEAVVITNKDVHINKKRDAFYKILSCLQFSANKNCFPQIHGIAQDEIWEKQLKKRFGFQECKGKYLFLDVRE